jgi:radical SAM superfamily enzyme YgiQ (UPF0313 family)
MYFSLGLLYLAAILEEEEYEITVSDQRSDHNIVDIPKSDYYMFTATTSFEITDAIRIAKYLKYRDGNECVTVIGGHHATLFPTECSEHFDVVVRGDGENAVVEIVEEKISNGIILGKELNDLNAIPFPARHLLPEEAVFSNALYPGEKYGLGPKSTTVISGRNCPYNCAFCPQTYLRTINKQVMRLRSPEGFVSEIKYLQERYNCHHLRFVDDLFTVPKKRMMKICELLEPLGIHYRTQTRADRLDEEMCEALKSSGCEEMGLGVESGDQYVLDILRKGITVEQNKEACRMIREAGMIVKTNFMVGLPKETWQTIRLNREFIMDVQPDKYILNMFCPFPGCDIAQHPINYGVKILDKDWSKYYNFTESFIETDVASNQELNDHYRQFSNWLESGVWRKSK